MRYTIVFLFFLLLLTACVDKVTLSTPGQPESGILLQGRFVAGNPAIVQATMYELYQYDQNRPKPLSGAKVALHDENGHIVPLSSIGNGQFTLNITTVFPDFPIVVGSRYRLVASLPSGQVYESAWEELLDSPKPTAIDATILVKERYNAQAEYVRDTFYKFSVNTPLIVPGTSTPVKMLWEMDQSYKLTDLPKDGTPPKTCYAFRPLLNDNVLIVNGLSANTNTLTDYPLVETLLDYRFAEGYYLLLYQHAISDDAYTYFTELNQLLAKKGTLFDPPAGAIRSNISNTAQPDEAIYGYFYVSKPDTAFYYISPAQSGYPKPFCPLPPTVSPGEGNPPKNSCDDCFYEPGGALPKPYWWRE